MGTAASIVKGRAIALLLAGLVGCAETTQTPAKASEVAWTSAPETTPTAAAEPVPTSHPLAPFEHADDTEYQNGLADLLTKALALGVGVVTSVYRWGYLTGLQEASLFEESLDSTMRWSGCLAGAFFVGHARGNQIPLVKSREGLQPFDQFCDGLRNRELDGYGPQGKLLSKVRLKVVEQSAKYVQDPSELNVRVTIFMVGYNMGFAHAWEAVDHEAQAAKTTLDGCSAVMAVTPPPSPELGHAIADKCSKDAKATRESENVRDMKCLLVGNEANSDLSGLRYKVGCPNKTRTAN